MSSKERNTRDHFVVVNGKMACKHCRTSYGLKTGISNLVYHLEHVHPGLQRGSNQATLSATMDLVPRKEVMDARVLRWISETNQPYSTVDHPAFKEMFEPVDYFPPCRQTISTRVLDRASHVEAELKRLLQEAPSDLSLTTDTWTSDADDSYLVVIAHLLTEGWCPRHYTIGFELLTERHTSEYLAKCILSVIAKYGVEGKVASIVTDNAANAHRAIEIVADKLSSPGRKVLVHRCMAHVLHLAVTDLFKDNVEAVQRVKDVVTYFHHNTNALPRLKDFCSGHGEHYRKPKQDVSTRWNSTYDMLVVMIAMKAGLRAVTESPQVSDAHWAVVKNLISLLAPFKHATEELSAANKPTLSKAAFMLRALRGHATGREWAIPTAPLLEKLAKYQADLSASGLLPAFFDPRFNPNLTDAETIAAIKEFAPETLVKPTSRAPAGKQPNTTDPEEDIFAAFHSDELGGTRKYCSDPEINTYLALGKLEYEGDPLAWWSGNAARFPRLAPRARNQLVLAATSASSERAFSAAGNVVTDLRTNLKPESVGALVLAHDLAAQQRAAAAAGRRRKAE